MSDEQQEDVTRDRNSESLPDQGNKVERLDPAKIDLDDDENDDNRSQKRKKSNKTPFFY